MEFPVFILAKAGSGQPFVMLDANGPTLFVFLQEDDALSAAIVNQQLDVEHQCLADPTSLIRAVESARSSQAKRVEVRRELFPTESLPEYWGIEEFLDYLRLLEGLSK